MCKYVIISKSCKGNKPGTVCTVTYQVKGKELCRFKVDLYCVKQENDGNYIYAFLENTDSPYIVTGLDRKLFLNEFYEFQKGAIYRQAHPITKTYYEVLQDKQQDLQKQLQEVNLQLNKEKYNELECIVRDKVQNIENKSLTKFCNSLLKSLNCDSRYVIKPLHNNCIHYKQDCLYIYDTQLNIPVKLITFDNEVSIKDLSIDEQVSYLNKLNY